MGHGGNRHLVHLFAALLELVHHVDVGGGQEDVDARVGSVLNGFPCGVYVAFDGARQPADDRRSYLVGDEPDRFEVPRGTDGNIDAHTFQLVGDFELFLDIERTSGGLLPVS